MLRAKFTVQSVKRYSHSPEAEEVELRPVYSSDPSSPNHSWSKATPAGSLTMTISNPEAVGEMELGKSYFLDFTPAAD